MINQGGHLGVVTACYPEGNAVDVILKDGSRLYGVQVMAHCASSGTGEVDLPDVGLPIDESRWNLQASPEYYIRACVDIYDSHPVVSGFIYPQVTQLKFKEKNRRIMRHASDVYSTIDGNGNIEICHPAGFFIRIGEGTAHDDLTARDTNKKWKITKNTTRSVSLHVVMPNGKASFTIAPNGDTTYTTQGKIDVTSTGDTTVTCANATVHATTLIKMDAPNTEITGNLKVDGSSHLVGAVTIDNGAAVTGGLTEGGKNVGHDHHHSNGTALDGNTGNPI